MEKQINKERKVMHLCQDCFAELQEKLMDTNDLFNQFSNSDDFAKNFFQGMAGMGQNNHQTRTRTRKRKNRGGGLLEQLGNNVSDDARSGKIDPVIGRDEEVQRVVETLHRRNKHNPGLSGQPGARNTSTE